MYCGGRRKAKVRQYLPAQSIAPDPCFPNQKSPKPPEAKKKSKVLGLNGWPEGAIERVGSPGWLGAVAIFTQRHALRPATTPRFRCRVPSGALASPATR